jgi:hypothetical protein
MIFRGSETDMSPRKTSGTSAGCTAPERVSGDAGHVARRTQCQGPQSWTRAANLDVDVPAHRSESRTRDEKGSIWNASSVAAVPLHAPCAAL